MAPKLFAFDLDGTLLTSEKKLSDANKNALNEMASTGAIIALASGRLGSSMKQFAPELQIDVAMLTLNGAAVYMNERHESRLIYEAPLDATYADYLISYVKNKPFALNYYINDKLHAVRNDQTGKWLDIYYEQTKTLYNYLDSYSQFIGSFPSKAIFVGDESDLDKEESFFRGLWDEEVYICRTWEHYLEFLNPKANKGSGLEALADSYNISINDVVAFGDANNDIPMLQKAGYGIAVNNAPEAVKKVANKISPWTNDEDAVAREWELIKRSMG